ncbi:MAG: hypothetical protein WD965_01470 [Actinomycetota bacterium]
MATAKEMTLEQEIDRIFAALGNAEIVSGEGSRPIVASWTPEPEDQEPEGTAGEGDDWDQD